MPRVGAACSFVSLVLLSAGIVVFAVSVAPAACPVFCVCDTWYDLQRASCTGRHLYSIHTGVLPNTVRALDVSDNSISALADFELQDAGLGAVKYLNLSRNAISQIDLNAFGGLTELTVLDLSRNRLYFIPPDVFIENPKLRILQLDGNDFNPHVPKLRSPYLTSLSMVACRINHMPVDTFKGLTHLRSLDLADNFMIQVDVAVFQPLVYLRELSLGGNPWSCNLPMFQLQIYLRRQMVEFRTVCGIPPPGPKKFEKMIIAPTIKLSGNRRVTTARPRSTVDTSQRNVALNSSQKGTDYPLTKRRLKTTDETLPYVLLASGFILGSSITLMIAYVWLVCPCRCNDTGLSRELRSVSSRLSFEPLHYEPIYQSENHDSTTGRSGSPPPPYREVMLCPGLYPSPTVLSFNDNAERI